jgi:hypothetical protein
MIRISHNIDQLERELSDLGRKQLPFALALATNDAATAGQQATGAHMQRRFASPTRFTLNAFRVDRATKRYPVATVERKTIAGRRHYLETQESGGARALTGFERLLGRAMPGGLHLVPASHAKLNRFGNMTPGQRREILAAVRGSKSAGRATGKTSRNRGVFATKPGSRLSPGVYRRRSRQLYKVAHFIKRPARYRPGIDLDRAVFSAAQAAFPDAIAARLSAAIRTAR